jgi:hypothetical protein
MCVQHVSQNLWIVDSNPAPSTYTAVEVCCMSIFTPSCTFADLFACFSKLFADEAFSGLSQTRMTLKKWNQRDYNMKNGVLIDAAIPEMGSKGFEFT